MRRLIPILTLAAAAFAAHAQSINVDLDRSAGGTGYGAPAPGFPGAAGQPGFWNALTAGSSGNVGIVLLDGSSTTVTITRNGNAATAASIPGGSTDYGRLCWDYDAVYQPQNSIDYTILGLDPGVYRLCAYAYLPGDQGWYLDQFNVQTYYSTYLSLYVNNVSAGSAVTSGAAPVNTFVNGVTHAFFNFTVGAGAPPVKIISSTGASNHERAALNGFQLMKYTGSRLYVNDNAAGLNNGTSWTDAFTNLQDALALAGKSNGQINEIWVAAGTYKPHSAARGASFVIPSGVRVYGGFAGNENALAQRGDPAAHETVLSGDLGTQNNLSDNSYHVIVASNTSYLTRLDGFTVRDGSANGGGTFDDGGALYIDNGQIEVRNCLLRDCYAGGEGAFVYLTNNAYPYFVDCDFFDGFAVSYGGAIRNAANGSGLAAYNCRFISCYSQTNGGAINSTAGFTELYNCVFSSNYSGGYGGGVLVWGAGVTAFITNCTFWNNGANAYGGVAVMFGAAADVENTVLYSNPDIDGVTNTQDANIGSTNGSFTIDYSLVGGWNSSHPGTGVFTAAPGFVNATGPDGVAGTLDDDFRPAAGSYLIDRGSNPDLPADSGDLDRDNNKIEQLPLDLAGNPRRVDDPASTDYGSGTAPIVDIGAYEFQVLTCNPCDSNCDGSVNQFDIQPFVNAVTTHSGCSACAGDTNSDGTTNTFDINGFIGCLNP